MAYPFTSTLVRIKDPYYSAQQFKPSEIESMVAWLDDSFVAVTTGEKVHVPIRDTTVTIVGTPVPERPLYEKYMLIMKDHKKGRIVIAAAGQYVVKTPRGIEVYDAEEFDATFCIATEDEALERAKRQCKEKVTDETTET